MAAASHQMMIKYGLAHEPTAEEVARWAGRARTLISQGIGKEAAGDQAAKQMFTAYRTRHYASQADTIDTLLRLAEEK